MKEHHRVPVAAFGDLVEHVRVVGVVGLAFGVELSVYWVKRSVSREDYSPAENTPCFAMLIACAGSSSDKITNTAKTFLMLIPP